MKKRVAAAWLRQAGTWAYHGTTKARLSAIMRHGLLPDTSARLRGSDEGGLFFSDEDSFADGYGGADTLLRFSFPRDARPDQHPVTGRLLPHSFITSTPVRAQDVQVRTSDGWVPLASVAGDVSDLIDALRDVADILDEARELFRGDLSSYMRWAEETAPMLAAKAQRVDALFTGETPRRSLSVADALDVLSGSSATMQMADGGYSRLTLHGPGDNGPVMSFSPSHASYKTRGRWEKLVELGFGTPGGHVKVGFEDKIPGGLADEKDPSDFDADALTRGTQVELEHTNSRSTAQEIAMDHLTEDPRYYDKLEEVEKSASARVAVRYKEKKKVKTKDGDEATVYVYSERQVQNRNREKAERVEKLRHSIDDLREQVRKDIDADDPKKRLTALAVALIDVTFERVGNDDSADDGHFGVTGWLKKHVTFSKGKARIKYVGKSGVDHEKEVSDTWLVKALKDCCGDKEPDDALLLSFGKDDSEGPVKVTSRDVNAYLSPFDVTAKDLRGFHANVMMQDQLRAIRKKGPKLPDDKREKEKVLKAEFKEALEATAEAVGHEASTLRTQYLVPGLEDTYMKDGTVNDKLRDAACRVASAWLRRADHEFDVAGLSVQEIQAVLRGAGLGVSGTRQVLVTRLDALLDVRELFRGKTDEEVALELTVPRLRDVFRSLGLHVSGTKPSLVSRLKNMANRVVVPKAPRKKEDSTFYVLWENPATGRTEALSVASSRAQAERSHLTIEGRLRNVLLSAGKHLDLASLNMWVGTTPAPDVDGDFLTMLYEVARLEDSAMGPALGGDRQRLQEISRQVERAKSRFRLATKTDGEKEDEEVERLVRPSPKKKPPRDDSRRERMEEHDPDLDEKDPDLSMNYKDVGG